MLSRFQGSAAVSVRSTLWNARVLVTRSQVLAPVGRTALQTLSWLLRHNPMQRYSRRMREARYVNAGCGRKAHPGFINLDYTWYPGVDLLWDLSWELPFQDGSLHGIYTEHCLEHLPFELVTRKVLPEFQRVLAPGGRLRLIVPDAGLYLRLYAEAAINPGVLFPLHDDALATPIMYVNRCFRDHDHLYAYDFETFRHFLLKARFSNVERRGFMDGCDSALLLDSLERFSESLYLEAVK
jgi:predicted SAM-dependent methyltransferase